MACELYQSPAAITEYIDKKQKLSKEEYLQKIRESTTVYVGNLSMYTPEESIYELFSMCGTVLNIQMGINRKQGTPIGFCFVQFQAREEAVYSVQYLSQTKLDNRIIRVDYDIGFQEGRQYGRGKGGVQWRDVFRKEDDPDRPKITLQSSHHRRDHHYQGRREDDDDRDYRRKKLKRE